MHLRTNMSNNLGSVLYYSLNHKELDRIKYNSCKSQKLPWWFYEKGKVNHLGPIMGWNRTKLTIFGNYGHDLKTFFPITPILQFSELIFPRKTSYTKGHTLGMMQTIFRSLFCWVGLFFLFVHLLFLF